MVKPNKYGTEVIQNELLDIMKIFHNFCVENNIDYSLYGGSCLGAVRHKGFIPWDDDLDICVDRKNYIKLIKVFDDCTQLKCIPTIWINRIQKKDAIKIMDYIPTLDVFVIDNVPNSQFKFKVKLLLLSVLQGMLKEDVSYKNFSTINKFFLFTTHVLGLFFSKKTLRNWYNAVSQIGNNKPAAFVHCSNTSYSWIRNIYPINTWQHLNLVAFEDAFFYIPTEYDTYLKICYGDYMKLPTEKNRVPEHVKKS